MKTLEFGSGKIGIRTINRSNPAIILSELHYPLPIGSSFAEEDSTPIVELVFKNREGLNLLIEALQICRENILELPPELRMGA